VCWSLAAFAATETVERAVVAAPAGAEPEIERAIAASEGLEVSVVTGGSSRSRSVANALAAAPSAPEQVVVVHDAARPLVTAALIDRCVERLRSWGCDGVIAAARSTDTVKEADAGGRVIATLERSNLWAVQTPQVFRAETLRAAMASAELDRAYDDAQLVEAAAGDVRIVEAPRDNLKVTTPFDLRVAELLLSARC
jgi:2-C-methyl-D-erythritol 4-phosphate cytidylyltransferase